MVDCEQHEDELRQMADLVIDTHRCPTEDVFVRIAARIQDRPMLVEPLIDVIIGGQYGSEGKGNLVQFLAPEYDVLVRVGGPTPVIKSFEQAKSLIRLGNYPLGRWPELRCEIGHRGGALLSALMSCREKCAN
jgi:adenylosuccinate synthase